MEQGDLAIVFPNMIHHYQVFSPGTNSAFYIYPPLSLIGQLGMDLQKYSPKNPVIPKNELHMDVLNAIQCLNNEEKMNPIIEQAYIQIILARSMPLFELKERSMMDCSDIIYQTVSYIAAHFKENTLDNENLLIPRSFASLSSDKFSLKCAAYGCSECHSVPEQ